MNLKRVTGFVMTAFAVTLLIASCDSSNNQANPGAPSPSANANPSVLGYHKNITRDGSFIDAALTHAGISAGATQLFSAAIAGPTYAQPLYFENGPNGAGVVIVATEQNQVSAINATTGAIVWQKTLGTPVPVSQLHCGNIDPVGVTGTPVIDAGSRTIYLDALVLVADGNPQHQVFALSVDDGSIKSGWPVTVQTALAAVGKTFDAIDQNQRGAVTLLNGTLYLPYGGNYGDCGDYHGWVVGINENNPAQVNGWSTVAAKGGAWAPGGLATDGNYLYVGTGNTDGATTWSGGDAVIRLNSSLNFSRAPDDYFAPTDWQTLDTADRDLGSAGPVLFTMPGSSPSNLVLDGGKNGYLYLLDRDHLGGLSQGVAQAQVSDSVIIGAPAVFGTAAGTFAVMKASGNACPGASGSPDLLAVNIVAGSPPSLKTAWCATQNGRGSPMVTTSNGSADATVWSVGAEGDNALHAFDGVTGTSLYTSGSLGSVRRFQTPIEAKGVVFVATDNALVAYKVGS